MLNRRIEDIDEIQLLIRENTEPSGVKTLNLHPYAMRT